MTSEKSESFGKFRGFFWPIHSTELKKFLPMLGLGFLIGFVFNILRGMKEFLLVTAAGSGAEVIPFAKVWAMLPMALFVTSLFIFMSHHLSTRKIFYIMVGAFLGFYLIFTFILYPLRDVIHPHQFADSLQSFLPKGFSGFVAMIRYWSYTWFYAMSELWGTVILSILFWGFANEVTKVSEAKRFYGLLGLGVNASSIAAGKISYYLASRAYNPKWIIGEDRAHQSLILLTLTIVLTGLVAIVLFRWYNKSIVKEEPQGAAAETNKQIKKLENKGSMRESMAYIAKSKYLLSIAMVVFCYNICINLLEVLWKDQVRALYPDKNDFLSYMSQVTYYTGILATLMAFFVSANLFRRFGWTVTALLTPVVLIITSIGFFGFLFSPEEKLAGLTSVLGMSPLMIIVFFGSAQNCLSRSCKYTVFDGSKEVAYIPLSKECRMKGKSAIDGVGSRMGKSSGALLYQGLLGAFATLANCVPYVAGLLIICLSGWIFAIRSLGRQFSKLTEESAESIPVEERQTAESQVI